MFEFKNENNITNSMQLVDMLKNLIIENSIKSKERLPSVRNLSTYLKINPNTVLKAYQKLQLEGYIYTVKGVGSFVHTRIDVVSDKRLKKIEDQLKILLAEANYLGLSHKELMEIHKEVEQTKQY